MNLRVGNPVAFFTVDIYGYDTIITDNILHLMYNEAEEVRQRLFFR